MLQLAAAAMMPAHLMTPHIDALTRSYLGVCLNGRRQAVGAIVGDTIARKISLVGNTGSNSFLGRRPVMAALCSTRDGKGVQHNG